MRQRLLLAACLCAFAVSAACGDDGDSDDAATPGATPDASAAATAAGPGIDRTEEALAAILQEFSQDILAQEDVPPGWELRRSQPVSAREAAVANVGVTPLAEFLNGSGMRGAWANFYTRAQPESGLSSIVYIFPDAGGPRRFVDVLRNLTPRDYPAAQTIQTLASEPVGEVSQMMLYVVPGSRTLELTWAQGDLAGQIVLRYAGDVNNPDDIAFLTGLARVQSGKMP